MFKPFLSFIFKLRFIIYRPRIGIVLVFFGALQGCASLSYYFDAINGHFGVLEKQQPIHALLADEQLDPGLRSKLTNLQQAREFAVSQLLLPDNDSYRNYADIGREYVVWNVIATDEFSTQPMQWCFLFAGCLNYRGYFAKQDAELYAQKLALQGKDVYVAGARAYSTLGWFDDPILNTMMYSSEARRVGVMFHELAHQKLYINDDSAFNEAFAVFVEQEGIKRWLLSKHKNQQLTQYNIAQTRKQQLNRLLQSARDKLNTIYKSKRNNNMKRQAKQGAFIWLQQEYQTLKQTWSNYKGYDKWMLQALNNAHLALVATYYELVPIFEQLLAANNGDLAEFYINVGELGELSVEQRRQKINQLLATKH